MRPYQSFFILVLSSILFSTCQSSTETKKNDPPTASLVLQKSKTNNSVPIPQYLYLKDDSLNIATDKKTYRIPSDPGINYKNSFPAIYQIEKDSIKKSYNLILNNCVYFTTYEDVGTGYRGHLYALDTKKRKLVYDKEFDRNYLYSSAGVFIFDIHTNKIFAIDNPDWYERKQTAITFGAMYSINDENFKFFKNVYESGEKTEDTSLIKFYDHSLANNGSRGLALPEDWWKQK